MKNIFAIFLGLFLFASTAHAGQYGNYGDVHVDGYYRSSGTYVEPHYRSKPDGNPYNNYGNQPSYGGANSYNNHENWQQNRSLLNPNPYRGSPLNEKRPGW